MERDQRSFISMVSAEVLGVLFSCLNESTDEPDERERKLPILARLRQTCCDAIHAEFSAKKPRNAIGKPHSFCEVSRLQFPSTQCYRAGELQPVR